MTINEQKIKCFEIFDLLEKELSNTYERTGSPRNKLTAHLCPNGTSGQLTYYGKPEKSFRVAKVWNWYANPDDCDDARKIQCYTRDMPWAKKRWDYNKAGDPIYAWAIGLYIDHEYRIVYGNKYDRKTKKWSWLENSIEDILTMIV